MKKRTTIAVVGMACLFPGAPDLNKFWHNIVNKVDATCEAPRDRWIVEPDSMYHSDPMPDKAYSKRSCLIHDFKFDSRGIDLDEQLLKELDPLHQMVLTAGREALSTCVTPSMNKENIGTVLAAIALPTDASSSITRKILGTSFEEKLFGDITPDRPIRLSREECLAGRVISLPGAILAEGLGLGGGSHTLDAACASSLYAVKFACDELCSFRADAMLAGGVSRPESLYTQVGFSQLRALSPSGRCAPFDQSADGLVVGEGVGMLVLKRLDDALRDQDHIYALIKGIGLSNDMRGNLLAPDSGGQVRAMRSAYADAGWSPRDVDLIECHGTGTLVGDAIELQSLRTLWDEPGWSPGQCAIGSIKSMIGHLLTGAGAAGMIKTLLALKNKTLPPSLNFSSPPAKSPLHNSPFRVQAQAEPWVRRDKDTPRRTAVSAFGFGGINSHLLFEEWDPEIENCRLKIADYHASTSNRQSSIVNHQSSIVNHQSSLVNRQSSIQKPPIAIIGMASAFGSLTSLKAFQETVFRGESIITKRPEDRWNGCDTIAEDILDGRGAWGGYMNELSLNLREFRIPPNEIPDILLQHLLMLKVSAEAMKDAGLPLRQERTDMGAYIGIDFDFEATDFHLRWHLQNLVRKWKKTNRPGLILDDEKETGIWLESLRDAFRPPLTATRTLGALGGVVASRIAREFRFGGPSYVVSNEAASGLKALEIGVRSLQQKETNAVLVGAVDLCGDVRSVITSNQIRPFTRSHKISPFDRSADGSLPGEGAAAVVIKRLDQAIADGDRIYSVIKGIGKAGRGGVNTHRPSKNAYILSLKRCFEDAGISPSSISFFETHGSGNPLEDRVESEALNEFFAGRKEPCAIGSVKPNIGHAGAASGLASLVKTSLCLYQEIIPPLNNFIKPGDPSWQSGTFHMPAFPQYWLRDRKDGPRRACTGAITTDGNCMHIILESFEYESIDRIPEKVTRERKRPLIAERVPVDLEKLYGIHAYAPGISEITEKKSDHKITLMVGGKTPCPCMPGIEGRGQVSGVRFQVSGGRGEVSGARFQVSGGRGQKTEVRGQRSEVRGQKTEDRGQRREGRGEKTEARDQGGEIRGQKTEGRGQRIEVRVQRLEASIKHQASSIEHRASSIQQPATGNQQPATSIQQPVSSIRYQEIMKAMAESNKATADAHKTFLDFSNELTRSFEKTFDTQTRLIETMVSDTGLPVGEFGLENREQIEKIKGPAEPAFSRDMCLEFATGSVARVLGPEFAVVDTYNVRVRLPDEPLMLVDRIISVEGEKKSLGSGRVVTEHDVLPQAWYLDGGRAPVCISVEAGQADLFLCSYLGIDHAVKGKRSYRLLDAVVKFYRGLPRPGDVIRYEIDIDHFVRQGDTYLFFFRFEGFIGNSRLISMHNGCAGFFTHEEVRNSGGIILTEEDTCPRAGKKPSDWKDLVPVYTESYTDDAIEALRRGDLAGCFGPFFHGIELAESLRLPGGRMKLIHRILLLEPEGGRYGLGLIRAEADINPDDWFLTCHFMDDMVMPGTLMYECCAHTLRVFIQRMGWVTAKPGICYEPVVGVESVLKCRGPVTPKIRHVWYEVEIKELGYAPEPYVIADALMYADGQRIVLFRDMSMKMTGIVREEIETVWEKAGVRCQVSGVRCQRSEDRGQRSEDRGQRTEDREQVAEYGGQRPEDRGQRSAVRGQRAEGRDRYPVSSIRHPASSIQYPATSNQQPVSSIQHPETRIRKPAIFDRDKILAFAVGKPSEAFGEPYSVFDRDRVIARLPGPPYSFLDRIVRVEPEAWALKPGGWIEVEYDVPPDAWYFKADRSSSMPFCILLEIALQPCGWLAAYLGSALKSEKDLKFRNLGGNAVLKRMILPEENRLSIRTRMTKVSEAGEMIIEHFDFEVLQDAEMVYSGNTYFGFFSKQALDRQVGIRGADQQAYSPTATELQRSRSCNFENQAPLRPDDPDIHPAPPLAMPAKALRMIDRIETYVRTGGPQRLGFIRGVKQVRPDEWFFKAHFYQDPVWPGSLGIESFLQLLKFMAIDRWEHLADSHRFELITGEPHNWIYRGQVIPENKTVEVEAVVTKIINTPVPTLYANGFLKVDGLYIYQMENFGFRLIPI